MRPNSASPSCSAELTFSDGSPVISRIRSSRPASSEVSSRPEAASASESIFDAGHLDVGQHADQRFLDAEIKLRQSRFLEPRPQVPLQPQRHVGVLGRVPGATLGPERGSIVIWRAPLPISSSIGTGE